MCMCVQKSYQRSACAEDTLMRSLTHFDQLVLQQSAQLSKAQRVHDLIGVSGGVSECGSGGVSERVRKGAQHEDDSSDDDDMAPEHYKVCDCTRFTHSLTHSLTYSFTHLLTHSLPYSLTHSLTHSLTF